MYFGQAIKFRGNCTSAVKLFVFWVVRPPVCLMSLRRVMSLFLSWVVRSLVSTLYVLVSCSNAWALLV